jgi:hypothetical protein
MAFKINQYKKILRPCYIDGDLCIIPLNNGQEAITNKEYYNKVSQYNWCISDGYAVAYINNKMIPLNRLLFPEIEICRFINHLRYDCRKENVIELKRKCYIEDGVCKIPLNNGQIAICDADRFDEVNKHTWLIYQNRYVATMINRKIVRLHTFLYPEWKMIDHINHDGLNNTSKNLREANHSQNMINSRVRKNSKSGYKGVCFLGREKKWLASISKDNKRTRIGLFKTAKEAAIAYNEYAIKLHGEYAVLNNIE